MYKTLASLLQKRLASHLDHRLVRTCDPILIQSGTLCNTTYSYLVPPLEVHEKQAESFYAIFWTGLKPLILLLSLSWPYNLLSRIHGSACFS